ncbi:hypothetical protein McanCB56680_003504 [Microsporum canis]|uniref:MYB DNA-binding domain-containing protein n=1 Tax=Arthroderma otae (strain ATCC MYA-4605 / CBS 113480) TaxID=554155 RepID=C5FRI0_ARTOC|nr:MYB DNA-binding domain-containing protein [Microsporum canis CBS 113480]EEQ32483.1 MYB DNA-binding domain-containing protein [Microsporum canis CBS 113480]
MVLRIVPYIVTGKVDISKILGTPEDEEKNTIRIKEIITPATIPTIQTGIRKAYSEGFKSPIIEMGIPNSSVEEWTYQPAPQDQISIQQQQQQSTVPSKRGKSSPTGKDRIKKQSKWSADEDALITILRGKGMKWEDISKRLPNRSPISCRLHYQNYLERRSEWDEDKKNKLARLYERFKADMWAKIAEEMAIPWRAAEAMHWQIGERGMAQRAGVTPFTFSNVATSPPQRVRRASQPTIGATRRDYPSQVTQLPSVAELTAGIPAYATHPSAGMHTTSPPRSPPSPSTLEAYRTNPRPHERRI